MILPAYCLTMARYNAWMNSKLFGLCAAIPDETRKQDLHAFFRSVHGTLDHILAVDLMFLRHVKHGEPTYLPPGNLYSDFAEMHRRRIEVDEEILAWAGTVPAAWLAETSTFNHHGDHLPRQVTRGFWVIQMFNHQTHHRGQLTTLLTQLGQEIGSTDMHMSVPR